MEFVDLERYKRKVESVLEILRAVDFRLTAMKLEAAGGMYLERQIVEGEPGIVDALKLLQPLAPRRFAAEEKMVCHQTSNSHVVAIRELRWHSTSVFVGIFQYAS